MHRHDGRVQRRAEQLGVQRLALFQVVGQFLQHGAQCTALLAGRHDGAIDVVELARGAGQRPWRNVEPALTSARRCATRSRWRGSSDSSDSAVSARSSGRPAPTRPASWRVQTASDVLLNVRRVKRTRSPSPSAEATASTPIGTSPWPRSCERTALALSPSSRPVRGLPWASRASKR